MAVKETGGIVTYEEHSVIGGLGSAVAEIVSEEFPVKIQRVEQLDKVILLSFNIYAPSGSYHPYLNLTIDYRPHSTLHFH